CGESIAGPGTPVASLLVSPSQVDLVVGDTIRLRAVAYSNRGDIIPGRAIAWTSGRSDLATVDDAGLVTTRAAGTAQITAATGGRTSVATVRIVGQQPVPIGSVTVDPAVIALEVGDTMRLTAVARSAEGFVVEGRTFVWASDRVDIATVDDAGLVTGQGAGRANVTATTGGRAGSSVVDVTVSPTMTPELVSLSPATIQAGWGSFTLTVKGVNIPPQARVTWNGVPIESFFVSSSEIQATVSPTYVASEGTAQVRVETPMPDPRTSNELVFTVLARPALSVDLLLSGNATSIGDRIVLRAAARDQFGDVIEGKQITWTSTDTTVAKIEGAYVRGLRAGTVELMAEAHPANARTLFHVVEAPLAEIGFQMQPAGTYPELFRRSLQPPGSVRRVFAPETFGRDMALSPDGTRFAFVGRDGSSNEDIYVANIDGSGVTRLTTDPAPDDQPTWSPDGESIAFRSHRHGKSDIWVMNADGSNQLNLTYAAVFIPEEHNSDPAWSPDGQTLAFSRGFGLGQGLYKVDRDGSDLRLFLEWPGVDLMEAAWSDDDLLAFRRLDRAEGTGGIEFVSGTTGDLVSFFWPVHSGARTPLFLGDGWLAVSAPVHPESTLPTIAIYHLTSGHVVVPMGEEFGRLQNPGVLVR
ncbi:MAG: PD40 domain-containing protein, partial [Gemmatimonadetes bacterium]|nr:PD40 domain-containing protein [Gemmatimonadota bacterium]